VTGPGVKTNVASVSGSEVFDPNPNNNSGSATVTPQQADLHLVKTVNQPRPNVGDTVTFTLALTNQGPNTATNVTVTDLLPAGLPFVSATVGRGTYNPVTGVWAVGTLASQAGARLAITARVTSPTPATNSGTAAADPFDPDPADNTASATITPQQADRAVTKTVDNPRPDVGDIVTFTVTLTNNGPDGATHIFVLDTLPAEVTFVSATASRGTFIASAGAWSILQLPSGSSAILVIKARVISPASATNTA